MASASSTEVRITTSPSSYGNSSENQAAVSTPALAAGASSPQSTTLTAPTAPGTYYVWIIADNTTTANQGSNTGNDEKPSAAFTVAAAANSDLTPTNISLGSTSVAPGGSLPVSWTILNQGSGTASASSTEVQITTSPSSYGNSSENQAAVSTPALAAGASSPQSTTLTAPTAPGTYYVWIIADNTTTANQGSNTGNDEKPSAAFTVAAAANSDLTPTNISLGSTSVAPGGSLPVSWTILNQGSGTASASSTEVRITTSPSSYGNSSENQAAVSTPALAAGASSPQSTTLTAPTAPGTYYVWIIADNTTTANQGSNTGNDEKPSAAFTVAEQVTPPPTGPLGGFDAGDFPAHPDTMAWLAQNTNLAWCGYYLYAPSQGTWTGWLGQASALQENWHLAPIYVGRQDPLEATAQPDNSFIITGPQATTQGSTDGSQAVQEMGNSTSLTGTFYDIHGNFVHDPVPLGQNFNSSTTVVFLDIEYSGIESDSNTSYDNAYIFSWCQAVVDGGYTPGIYCHPDDAEAINVFLQDNPIQSINADFWIAAWPPQYVDASGPNYPNPDPASSGYAGATSWQYASPITILTSNGPYSVDLDSSTLFGSDGSAMPATLSIAATNANQNEGNGGTTAFTFTVTRSGDSTAMISATWAVTGSGANPANAADFGGGVLPSGTVSFAAGDTTPKVITVNVAGDTVVEPDEGFTVTLSGASGATIASASAVGTILNDDVAVGPVVASVTDDFNGDGTSDILFQNSNSGLLLDWQMANGTYSKAIPIAGASSDWKEIGTGDFNGDGTTDILFQNSNSGLLLDWQMANGTYTKAVPIAGASSDWKEIGTGDFNGDGTTDILFQNSNSGLLLDWQMANGTYSKAIPIAGASSDWKFLGTGDFNRDGISDILFQNLSSGLLLDWQMANGTYSKAIPIAGAASDWKYAGIGDFNGDGTSDILFQNSNSGLLLDWQMANGTYSKAVPIAGASSDWKVMSS